jgi:glycosyltransferase involved in cell wall biosynthesis
VSRVLAVAFDPVTERMPGPAIRAWNLALQLSTEHTVTLAGTAGADRRHPDLQVVAASGPDLDRLAGEVDVVFAPASIVRRHPGVASSGAALCIDLYDPTHLENLEAVGSTGDRAHVEAVEHQVSVLNEDLTRGDFFLCATGRQRDFWLGALASLGRVNPRTYQADPTLETLITQVPFGVDEQPPAGEPGALRRLFGGIGPDDPVLVWGGGVYNWFDPLSLLAAVEELRERRPTLRLVFLGMRHPNPEIPEMRVAAQLRSESDRRGLTGTHVFFNEGWVPYDGRGALLLDADVGVSTHRPSIETHFSSRTRVLDYLWAGLPTVLTGGDTLSEEIAAAGVGETVPAGDPHAIAQAVGRILDEPVDRDLVRAVGARYRWTVTARPLVEYCREPWRAADADRADRPIPDGPRSRAGRLAARLTRH